MKIECSFPMLLLLLFIGFKLCDVIAWSWIWVLSPFWIPVLLYCAFYIILIIGEVMFDGK